MRKSQPTASQGGGTLTTVLGAVLGAAAGAALLGGLSWAGGCGNDTPPPGVSADDRDNAAQTEQRNPSALNRLPSPPIPPDDTHAPEAAEPEPPPPVEKDKPYDGPWLAALAQSTPIYPTARFSKNRMGYIRRGAKVPVIDKPLKTNSCRKGFYPLVDGGYVCGKYATTNLDDKRVKAGVTPPNIDALLPYRYAYNKAHGTPLYSVVPSREDMLRYEPYLDTKRIEAEKKKAAERKQAKADAAKADAKKADAKKAEQDAKTKTAASGEAIVKPSSDGTAAASAKPASKIRPVTSARSDASASPSSTPSSRASASNSAITDADKPRADDGAGGAGAGDDKDEKPWWQHEGKGSPNVKLSDLNERDGALAKRMVRGFFIAVDRTFGANNRMWYKTTEGLVAPTDRMIIPKTPELKGIELGDGVTQAGFIRWHKAYRYSLDDDAFKRGKKLKRFTAIGLTGQTKLYKKRRYRETVEGWWMQQRHGSYTDPGPRPSEIGPDEKWVDVNLSRKTLVALIGDKPVYAALISPGKRSKNKRRDHRTPLGKWRVREKHITTTMDGDGTAGDLPYSIQDVPYVQYYSGSYALHGAFWHNNFGAEQSHGCINLSPLDAKHMFFWTEPTLPRGWHGVWSSDKRKGTLVVVHN